MLIIRLSAFALGGMIAAGLHVQLKLSLLWSAIAGIAIYITSGLLIEHLLVGRVGW